MWPWKNALWHGTALHGPWCNQPLSFQVANYRNVSQKTVLSFANTWKKAWQQLKQLFIFLLMFFFPFQMFHFHKFHKLLISNQSCSCASGSQDHTIWIFAPQIKGVKSTSHVWMGKHHFTSLQSSLVCVSRICWSCTDPTIMDWKGHCTFILTPYVVSTLECAWPAIYSWVTRPNDCSSSRYMGYHRFSQPLASNHSHCAQVSSTTLIPHDLRSHIMQIWFHCVHVQCAHSSGNSSRNLPSP